MRNFVFHNPTKIIFGRKTIPKIGAETAVYGKRVLLVFGRGSIMKNGIYDQVVVSLRDAGINFIEHGGVRSNPVLDHVQEGINKVKKHGLDVVVAVGGGSVLDSAKAICAGAMAGHDVWKFFIGKKSIKKALPLTTVLTLAASGSEMNSGMVITNEKTKEKFGVGNRLLYPKTSILDPEATFTVPPDYTAYGAIDAIAHVLEFYMTTQIRNTPVQDRLIEGLIINAMDSCERILANTTDYQARADLMWTATLALNGLTAAGLGRVGFPMHMIEHSLSALYDVAHGAGLSAVIPGWLQWRAATAPAKIARLGKRVLQIEGPTPEYMAAQTIAGFSEWFAKVGGPTSLAQLNIAADEIDKIAANALSLAKIWRLEEYSTTTIRKILTLCR